MKRQVIFFVIGESVAMHGMSQNHHFWEMALILKNKLISSSQTNISTATIASNNDFVRINVVLTSACVDMHECMHKISSTSRNFCFWSEAVINVEDDTFILSSPSYHNLIMILSRKCKTAATMSPDESSRLWTSLGVIVDDYFDVDSVVTGDINKLLRNLLSPRRICSPLLTQFFLKLAHHHLSHLSNCLWIYAHEIGVCGDGLFCHIHL